MLYPPGGPVPSGYDNYSNSAFAFVGVMAEHIAGIPFAGETGKPDQHSGSLLETFAFENLGVPIPGQATAEGIFTSQTAFRLRENREPIYRGWSTQRGGTYYPTQEDERWVPREFSPDGRLFAVVASSDSYTTDDSEPPPWEMRLFETHTGKLAAAVPVVDSTPIWFTPDGSRVVVLAPDKSPTIWDVPPARPWDQILLWWGIVAGAIGVVLALVWRLSQRRERPTGGSNAGYQPGSQPSQDGPAQTIP